MNKRLRTQLRKKSQEMITFLNEGYEWQLRAGWRYFESLIGSLYPEVPLPCFTVGFSRYLLGRANGNPVRESVEQKFSEYELDFLYLVLLILDLPPE